LINLRSLTTALTLSLGLLLLLLLLISLYHFFNILLDFSLIRGSGLSHDELRINQVHLLFQLLRRVHSFQFCIRFRLLRSSVLRCQRDKFTLSCSVRLISFRTNESALTSLFVSNILLQTRRGSPTYKGYLVFRGSIVLKAVWIFTLV
jgi:hypothetical protein